MQLTFLQAEVPLTKKFELLADGTVEKHSYPFVKNFSSVYEEVETPQEFADSLRKHANANHCLLKGNVLKPLKDESRSGSTDSQAPTEWVVFDVDGMDNIVSAEQFVKKVLPNEFQNTTYVVQHSASAGISGDGFRAHIFFLLSRPYSVAQIKQWLQYRNLTDSRLVDQLALSKNAITLRYPLDITVNQNDKLIYIAPPTCSGFDDPLSERIVVVESEVDRVRFDFPAPSSAELRHLVTENVNTLRVAIGLRRKEIKLLRDRKTGMEYLDPKSLDVTCTVTGIKTNSAGLIQLNIDGGDSWAYYYNPKNPRYLYNFKGEPTVLLKEFIPDYYNEVIVRDRKEKQSALPQPFTFRDHITDCFYAGIKDPSGKVLSFDQISKQNIEDFFIEFGMAPPDPLPTWERIFDPTKYLQYDADNKVYNDWQPTVYMEHAVPIASVPPTIDKVLRHVTAGDQESYDRFLNWLAFIYQNRTKSGTAWVLHGCPGTGKGVLFNSVIRPIFGVRHCVTKLIGDLRSNFNAYMETAIFVNVDETRAGDAGGEAIRVMNAVKNWITEPVMSIEAKHQNQRMSQSFVNFIFTTNDLAALPLQEGDRRFNVAPRQETPIRLSSVEIEELIPSELQDFAGFLLCYETVEEDVRMPLLNEAKEELRRATQTSIDAFCRALREGDLEYFIEGTDEPSDLYQEKERFKQSVEQWIKDAQLDKSSIIKTADLRDAFNVIINDRAQKTAKFKSMMHKRALPERNCREGEHRWRGWHIKWNVEPELARDLKIHLTSVPDPEDQIKKELKND